MQYQEIEVRFLEIDKQALIGKLQTLGAEDRGERLLNEKIVYKESPDWKTNKGGWLRLRTEDDTTRLTYKNRVQTDAREIVEEIEFEVGDSNAAEALLNRLGYMVYRNQQKMRHTFQLDDVTCDIDTWPRVPTYVELEGPNEEALMEAAARLELDWNQVERRNARRVIEQVYDIPVGEMTWFTFDRFE